MKALSAQSFSDAVSVTPQRAREIFRQAVKGKPRRGHYLPVVQLSGRRGGASGKSLVLHTNLCDPALLDLLGVSETLPSTAVEDRIKDRPTDRAVAIAMDKQRILRPVLAAPKSSAERAQIISDLLSQSAHKVGARWVPLTRSTLYDWIKIAESDASRLVPKTRCDRGKARVRISVAWDKGCGLSEEVQDQIKTLLEVNRPGFTGDC